MEQGITSLTQEQLNLVLSGFMSIQRIEVMIYFAIFLFISIKILNMFFKYLRQYFDISKHI